MHFKVSRKKASLFASIIFLSSIAFSKDIVKPKKPETVALMNEMLVELSSLKNYFVSEEKFNDPKNAELITAHLKEFTKLAKETRHNPDLTKENYKFSGAILHENVAEVERLFKTGNKSFARWQLAATVSMCMSCHTQFPAKNRAFIAFQDHKMYSSTFDQAEFLFATRAFDQAFFLYDLVIDGYPKNKASLDQVEGSLDRQLAYFSRLKRNLAEAIEKMKLHQKNKELPESLQTNLKAWITQFKNWEKQVTPDPKTASAKEIVDFTKKIIQTKWTAETMQATNPDLIPYLRVSGILYEYLQLNPKSVATPEILYWLAICDRSISNTIFYSLADFYLKECVIKFPTSAIAPSCYKEYELETIAGYTGSAGTFLPPEVRMELNQMKNLLDRKIKLNML